LDEAESVTEKEMNELRRTSERVIEELRKTDAVKASECSAHVERLQVLLSPVQSDVTCYGRLYHG